MSYVPSPFVFAATPSGGYTLTVTATRGGLQGCVLTSQSGPAAQVLVNSADVAYPYTLQAGDLLTLVRNDTTQEVSILHALMPLDDEPLPSPELLITTDPDGYQSIINADVTTDPDGYQTIQSVAATTGPDGYQTAERSTT